MKKPIPWSVNDLKTHARNHAMRMQAQAARITVSRTSLIAGDSLVQFAASRHPLLHLAEHPIRRDMIGAAGSMALALGIATNATDIMRFARGVMDHDRATLQLMFRKVFAPEEAAEITAWMDRVPGGQIAGGFAHRLKHGHDLAAMVELWRAYGSTGGVEWLNHVILRDFWTPHGVPFLPAGSGSVYDWLVGAGVAPKTALSLLSVTAAEAAAGLLGVRTLTMGSRAIGQFFTVRRQEKWLNDIDREAKSRSEREAINSFDRFDLQEDSRLSPQRRLRVALFCLHRSRTARPPFDAQWAHRVFRASDRLISVGPDLNITCPYEGGTRASLGALAAVAMLSASAGQAEVASLDKDILRGKVETAIGNAVDHAIEQRRGIRLVSLRLGSYRPLSAATNLHLALELAVAAGSVLQLSNHYDPRILRAELLDTLNAIPRKDEAAEAMLNRIKSGLSAAFPLQTGLVPAVVRRKG